MFNVTKLSTRLREFSHRYGHFIAYVAIVGFSLGALAKIDVRVWSDSEIWGVRQASACMTEWTTYACSLKPLFHVIVGATDRIFSDGSLEVSMRFARSVVVFTLLIVVSIWVLSRRSLTLLVCFLGSSTFLSDSVVARSDLLALPFLIAHAALLISTRIKLWHLRFGLILSGLAALLITPKVVVAFLCFTPIYISLVREHFPKGRGWRVGLPLLLAVAVAAGMVVAFVDLRGSATFFIRLFDYRTEGVAYWNLRRFQFLINLFRENPQFPALIALWLTAQILSLRTRRATPVELTAFLTLVATFIYPAKLPFFLSMQFALFFFLVGGFEKQAWWMPHATKALALFSILNGIYWLFAPGFTNVEQVRLSKFLDENLQGLPYVRVYDSVGVSNRGVLAAGFVGPGEVDAFQRAFDMVMKEKIEVMLITGRLYSWRGIYGTKLSKDYIEATPDFLLRYLEIEKPRQNFGETVVAELQKNFAPHLTPLTRVAIFNKSGLSATSWSRLPNKTVFSIDELLKMQTCEACSGTRIAISPFGRPFASAELTRFSSVFSFENYAQRESLWDWLRGSRATRQYN